MNYGDYVDFSVVAGGTGDAKDIDIILTFILEK
jgi:hypothetical protein